MKTFLLKITGLLGLIACCSLTIFLISSVCHLLKVEAGKTSAAEFFMIGANFFLFIIASIMTVVFYEKVVKKEVVIN